MALSADLTVRANLDLSDVFTTLASDVLGVSFGSTGFDPSALLAVIEGAAPPDLGGLRASVSGTIDVTGARLDLQVPTPSLPPGLADLVAHLGSIRTALPSFDVPELTGLDGLGVRIDSVRALIETGPLADLLGLVPGLQWSGTLTRAGGSLGAIIDLLRTLAGLTAMATTSRHLLEQSAGFAGLLDRDAADAAGATLLGLAGDASLVAALRNADPADAAVAAELAGRVEAYLDAVTEVATTWAPGMGFGEAALLGLDATGTSGAIEVASVVLTGVDLSGVTTLTADVRRMAGPLLEAPLPDPHVFVDGFLGQAALLTAEARLAVQTWDVAGALAPVTNLSDTVLAPVLQFQQALAGVGTEITGALRSLRSAVGEVDLTPVATALDAILQPVVTVLDAIEAGIGGAEATLTTVAGEIESGLHDAAAFVTTASTSVQTSIGEVSGLLGELHLQELADTLSQSLRTVAQALAAAQLRPYFDAAIDVITTAADIIAQVPFGMLPTDVQQEIVDACRPIKQLDLQPVEDTLRAELATIREGFSADALQQIDAGYQEVVGVLAGFDPAPHLAEFESTVLSQLRTQLDAVDPMALLAPVDEGIASVRDLLADLDLQAEVLAPLQELFAPVLDAIEGLDPAALLAPAQQAVDDLRTSITDALPVAEARETLLDLRTRAAGVLGRIDAHGVVDVLDDRVIGALAEMPSGPPAGPFGSILVSLAQASGFRADEPAVQDVIDWVSGVSVGGVVVQGRLAEAHGRVTATSAAVASLDPAPVAAAASAYHRALREAVAGHPDDSPLAQAITPLLNAVVPDDLLAGLADNRRRYQIALDADALLLGTLAASGRSEVTEAASQLHVALEPLGAFPSRLRDVLTALGLDPAGRPLRVVLTDLLREAVHGPVPGELAGLISDATAKVLEALDVVTQSGLDAVEALDSVLSLLDLTPIVDELTALHTQIHDEVAQLSPDALLGPVVASGTQVVDRLNAFDPLAPVKQIVQAALDAADQVFDSVRPTVVFAPVLTLYQQVMAIVSGLDLVSLLQPVLTAFDGIAAQLDEGFDHTGDALQELQDALPSEVQENSIGGSVSVDVGVSF
ncbi:hypothetical protein [Nocardioides jejuensis]|uniref:Uncharacterized protein n=1 Tax=Nocardioides jejuensis TaxID=2502782 RepID=A0A4R1CD73_9ACTN|nr:hypothetical protein [Nocardioides jejuensis]TCJ28950.1 hypothetical protein EPD65_07220 [Nocardioides jejuensis]